ncbi:hypothetical protein B0H16DRAFT_1861229 [Mycena metata]|uniref:F-box domain-containing protein n=1 Tax=Mycena metata TaxID=1033252 RepID=A0AAD7IG13_9AGAR|nr:hypothetical protein B0H16DRAFT_1770730 [Mycena metata]KAJ7742275.1 hypothetical protein B0H16DRAFT_1861229 [Mycena metata]
MHRALQIPEILRLICLQISALRENPLRNELSKEQSRQLALLARTCTTFSAPALHALWEFQNTIFHLLDCMPPGIWQKDRVPLLLAPGITNIALGTFRSVPNLMVLGTLTARCPSLSQVRLVQDGGSGTQHSEAVSSFVRGLTHIQDLTVQGIDKAAWEHLANLSSLHSLVVTTPNFGAVSSATEYIEPRFMALECLMLKLASFQTVMASIGTSARRPPNSYSSLRQIYFNVSPPTPASSLMQIYLALRKHLPPSTLEILDLDCSSQPVPQGPPATITTIQPLFYFTNLASVCLHVPTGMDLDDDAVLSMARAWPNLASLTLSCTSPPQTPPAFPVRTTLLSLLYLAENCSELGWLEMTVNASVIPPIDDRYRHTLQHSLYHWEIGDSRIISPVGVGRFLSGLFSNLYDVGTDEMQEAAHNPGVAESQKQLWDEVGSALSAFSDVREEERMRMSCTCK